MMQLKAQLKFYIDRRGMTITSLARLSGVSKQTISDWLAGTHPRKITQVKNVAEVLKVSVDHLCFGQGDDAEQQDMADFDSLLGNGWIGGCFEVRLRRMKKRSD